jgi:hypothetical protein
MSSERGDMQHEGVPGLITRSAFVLLAGKARILQVCFAGKHHYSHGAQMASQLKAIVAAERPDGVLVDLLDYDYVFGNDVCGLFIAGYDRDSRRSVPTCIVAIGKTRISMENLYNAGNFRLGDYLGFAESVTEGLAWLSM